METVSALVLFAHPAFQESRVNRGLIEAIRDLEDVTFHDLYEAYPDYDIHVDQEQRLLQSHDLIVFHHPFFWYSTPGLLKEWQDLVLEHGWAYGKGGDALRGKRMLSVITTGGREITYCREGYNRFTMRELLAPIEQTAVLCGIEYLPPFIVHGTHGMPSEEIRRHAADYRRVLQAFRDGRIDWKALRSVDRLNPHLDTILAT